MAASVTVRPDGLHEDLTDPAKQATSTGMPTPQNFQEFRDAYQRLSPHPDHFDEAGEPVVLRAHVLMNKSRPA